MPLYYQFIQVSTGKITSLDAIDKMICTDLHIAYSETDFSPKFQWISAIGDVVWRTNKWDQDMFDEILKDKDQTTRNIVTKYLNGEYKYECWVQR